MEQRRSLPHYPVGGNERTEDVACLNCWVHFGDAPARGRMNPGASALFPVGSMHLGDQFLHSVNAPMAATSSSWMGKQEGNTMAKQLVSDEQARSLLKVG